MAADWQDDSRLDQVAMRRRTAIRVMLFVSGSLIVLPPTFQVLDRSPAIETKLWMEPSEVKAGDYSDAVWINRILRAGCRGTVQRTHIDSSGEEFEFGTIDAVFHGPIGTTEKHRYSWTIPVKMKPGPATFRRVTKRGCGLFQWLIWPMTEIHKADYIVLPP